MATYKIKGIRYLKKYTARSFTPTYAANTDAQTVVDSLCEVPWEKSLEPSAQMAYHTNEVVDSESGTTGLDMNVKIRERLDAAMFCAEHKGSVHRVYANAACYVFVLPDMEIYPNLTSVKVKVTSDPYNSSGVRIAVHVSDTAEIPIKCSDARTGIAHVAGAVPREAKTGTDGKTYWYSSMDNVDIPVAAAAMKKYLFVVVALEEYSVVRGDWLEGSAYINPVVEIETDGTVYGWGNEIIDTRLDITSNVKNSLTICDLGLIIPTKTIPMRYSPIETADVAICTLDGIPCKIDPELGLTPGGVHEIDASFQVLKDAASRQNSSLIPSDSAPVKTFFLSSVLNDMVALRQTFSIKELKDAYSGDSTSQTVINQAFTFPWDAKYNTPGVGVTLQCSSTMVDTVSDKNSYGEYRMRDLNWCVLSRRRWLQPFFMPENTSTQEFKITWSSIPALNKGSMIYNIWIRPGIHSDYGSNAIGDISLYNSRIKHNGEWMRVASFDAPDIWGVTDNPKDEDDTDKGTTSREYVKNIRTCLNLPCGACTMLLTAHLLPGSATKGKTVSFNSKWQIYDYYYSGHDGDVTANGSFSYPYIHFTGRPGWRPKVTIEW